MGLQVRVLPGASHRQATSYKQRLAPETEGELLLRGSHLLQYDPNIRSLDLRPPSTLNESASIIREDLLLLRKMSRARNLEPGTRIMQA